ncbi:MAG: bifunctional adenosylcobinamide kinase/adenosylcobinamide-phosphate guanylyltransferase [Nitrospirae bacterium]|nr:bifunctional adenosylcobinamide kinase/adenosylcobinamide-phosphate guanylyltransferase [Nitrospirota bacterium]
MTFITGGARSGKSTLSITLASKIKGKKAFIATLKPLDSEMRLRVKLHKRQRGKGWDTYEEPIELGMLLRSLSSKYSSIVIDCLTLYLSNIMHKEMDIEKQIKELINAILIIRDSGSNIFIVSNEVGMGIVPENKMARRFRDMAGMLNQKVARIADEVYLVVSGIPIKISNTKRRGIC